MTDGLNERAASISGEFSDLEPRERLELLLEFAEKLPPLAPRYEAERAAGLNRVHECQTPVFFWVELPGGRVQIHAHVAPEAPTVKGFVSLLADIFNGATPDEVAAFAPDLVAQFGLVEALGMMRMRGLHAIAQTIRRKVAQAAAR